MCVCVYCVRRMYVCIKSSWPFDRSIKGWVVYWKISIAFAPSANPVQTLSLSLSLLYIPSERALKTLILFSKKTHTEKRGLVCVNCVCIYELKYRSITTHKRRKAANGSQKMFVKVRQGLKEEQVFFISLLLLLSVCLSFCQPLEKLSRSLGNKENDNSQRDERDADRERRRRYANKMFPSRRPDSCVWAKRRRCKSPGKGIRRDSGNFYFSSLFFPLLLVEPSPFFQIIKDECRSIQLSRVPQWSRLLFLPPPSSFLALPTRLLGRV